MKSRFAAVRILGFRSKQRAGLRCRTYAASAGLAMPGFTSGGIDLVAWKPLA
jgi:hypothetical protein